MLNPRSISLLIAWLLCSLPLAAVAFAQDATPTSAAAEFVGPFGSWRQVACGGVDDTQMLQGELDVLGTAGHSPVLYIGPGTCRITDTLQLGRVRGAAKGKTNITILGADPTTTSIVWAGPDGRPMMLINGVSESRFGRLTWDGGGTALTVYELAWDGQTDYFPTGNRHEYEVFQNLDPKSGVAIRAGTRDFGEAETELIGCRFIGPYAAGLFLYNFNVLDWWVWDSEFRGLYYAVTNHLPNVSKGAGGYAVNRSVFVDNNVDMGIGNTSFFASRWNYSRNANWHVLGTSLGNAPSPWTSQGEVVIDPRTAAFSFGTPGPLGLVDSTIRGPGQQVSVVEGYSASPQGDVWSIGNTFSSEAPFADRQPPYRRRSTDDRYAAQVDDPGPPALPTPPQPSAAPVFEVQGGDIQGALNAAGDQRAIVHIPFGEYAIAQTLSVGPNVTLTGDGYGATRLVAAGADPIVRVRGPSHAVLRDFSMRGSDKEAGILIENADSADGVVHVEQWISSTSGIGVLARFLNSTVVDLIDHLGSSNKVVDYRTREATLRVFNAAGAGSTSMYSLAGGELVSETVYYESNVPTNFIAGGSNGTLVLDSGKVQAKSVDTSQFGAGSMASLLNIFTTGQVQVSFGQNALALGFAYGSQGAGQPLPAEPSFGDGQHALWLPRSNAGGGSRLRDERAALTTDDESYLRDHLAPLRRAVPRTLGGRSSDAEEVVLVRVGGSRLLNGLIVQGQLPS
jgi:hypothetical protein